MKYPQLSEELLSQEFPEGATHHSYDLFYKRVDGVVYYLARKSRLWRKAVRPWRLLYALPLDFILDNYTGDADVR